MLKRVKRGFTIVELLLVISIITILMGIVTTVASESIKASRGRQAEALCALVQSGLATYHAQKGEWPITPDTSGGMNDEGVNGQSDPEKYVLTDSQVRQCVLKLVEEAKKGAPVMDVSGLYVSRSPGISGSKAYGMTFTDAVRGTKRSQKKMKIAEMYFGYPDPDSGYFRPFKIVYSISADQMTVTKQ